MIRVLIVEDDYHVATIHGAYVRRVEGFEVVGHASTVVAARTELRTGTVDLVLLDVFLPDGSGLDLLREASATTRPDFLVITAARDMRSVREAISYGAVHYLVKPFDFAQIEERLIAYRSMRRRLQRIGATHEREADQHEVDVLYSLLRGPTAPPKGHSGPTVAAIQDLVRSTTGELSAAEIARQIGISRSTAQRYLAQMVRQGHVDVRLRYGAAGRPEHRYRLADTDT